MARLITPVFNPNRPVIVRRPLVAGGRHLRPGDAFEWRKWAIDQRKTRLLFESGKLMHPGAPAQDAPLMLTPKDIQTEIEDEDILALAAAPLPQDDLDDLNMKQLREIATEIGVDFKLRRDDQRAAIRAKRAEVATAPLPQPEED